MSNAQLGLSKMGNTEIPVKCYLTRVNSDGSIGFDGTVQTGTLISERKSDPGFNHYFYGFSRSAIKHQGMGI
jgi:hypothetical protein